MKKTVAIILFSLFASILLSCTPSSTPTPTSVPNQTPAPATKQSPPGGFALPIPIQVTVTTGKSYYLSGEDIDIKISLERSPQNPMLNLTN